MVKVNYCRSESYSISSSVSRGSVLAAFYVVFINDLSNVFFKFSKYKFYADVLTIYKTVDYYHDSSKVHYDLNSFMKRANEWQLNINFEKCCSI